MIEGTKMLTPIWMKNMTTCKIVHRNTRYDVFVDDHYYGSGKWDLVNFAIWAYKFQGFDVEVVE
jgi:hypothetical protein